MGIGFVDKKLIVQIIIIGVLLSCTNQFIAMGKMTSVTVTTVPFFHELATQRGPIIDVFGEFFFHIGFVAAATVAAAGK